MKTRAWLTVLYPLTGLLLGCNAESPSAPAVRPPEVLVATPVTRTVTDYEVFTGRTEASARVDIRSRVTGYLDQTFFEEGALVERDARLFLIDPRPYRAELARAEASLAQARSRVARLDRDYERAQGLLGRQAISREEYDKLVGDRQEARSAVNVAEAAVELAQLSVDYTEVRAPFAGRISRRMIDPGNLVKADETILTTLVSEEPMFAYFDVDERTLLRQLLQEGRLETARLEKVPIEIGLSDEEGFPHRGIVNFVDNRVDPNTGTMWMRGEFVKPDRLIKPGVFIRVRFPLGQPYQAILVPEQALGTDQGQKFLYVVDEQNKVKYRKVQVGRLNDGLRVIVKSQNPEEGLEPGERIVVSGLQRVRVGNPITPKPVAVESLVTPAEKERP